MKTLPPLSKSHNILSALGAYASIWYLLSSIILWVLGWCAWWMAIPICALLLYGGIHLWTQTRLSYTEQRTLPVWCWIFIISWAGLCILLCGFDGRVVQSWDFIVRNPLYAHLIQYDWPMQLKAGEFVVYPIQFWMVPSALSKLWPAYKILFLQCWAFLGLLLIAFNLCQTLGARSCCMMLVSLLIFAPLTHAADDILNVIFHQDAYYSVHFRLLSPLTQLFNTFHFYIAGCLVLSLLIGRHPTAPILSALVAMLGIVHPMLAVLMFPWFLGQYILLWKHATDSSFPSLRSPFFIAIVAVTLLAGVFYASSTSSTMCLVFEAPHAKGYCAAYIWAYLTGALLNMLPLILLWYFTRKNILLYTAALIPLITLVWAGADNGISEWWYKFSVAYAFIFLLLTFQHWNRKGIRIMLCVLLACSLLTFLREMQKKELPTALMSGFQPHAEFISGQYADMNHIDAGLRKQFVSKQLLIPILFRDKSGHSLSQD